MYSITLGKGEEDRFDLFVDWCHALLDERFGVERYGGLRNRHTLKVKSIPELIFLRDPISEVCSVTCGEPLPDLVRPILRDASGRTARGDLGRTQWWRIALGSRKTLDPSFGLHIMRMLGQTRAFSGRYRLGREVLAEFSVEDPTALAAFADQRIKVIFRCIGPGHGPRADKFARRLADRIRAVLSFCTGSILQDGGLLMPVTDAEFPPGAAVNPTLPELSVQGVPIWSRLIEAASLGAQELVSRAVNALTAYEHAQHQPTVSAATLFYVAAIEALTVPNHRYLHQRVTSRFAKSLVTLAGPKLEEALKHAQFGEAFESANKRIKSPEKLASRIYELRSSPVHTGQLGLERDISFAVSSDGSVRAALLGEIAEAAILGFLTNPFTSLIGHPDFDPSCRIELTEEEHASVRMAAQNKGQGIEDYILHSLGLASRQPR